MAGQVTKIDVVARLLYNFYITNFTRHSQQYLSPINLNKYNIPIIKINESSASYINLPS